MQITRSQIANQSLNFKDIPNKIDVKYECDLKPFTGKWNDYFRVMKLSELVIAADGTKIGIASTFDHFIGCIWSYLNK